MLFSMAHETRVAFILGFALLLFLVLSGYVYWRVAGVLGRPAERGTGRKRWPRWAYMAILAAVPVCAVAPRFFARQAGDLAPYMGGFAAVVVLSVLISTALLLPYELVMAARALVRKLRGARNVGEPTAEPVDGSRRSFVQRVAVGGAVGLGVGSTVYGTLLGRHDYTLETVPIKLAKLPRALDGFRIVQLSDLHVGSFVADYELGRGLELVRRARPDLIVLTGDLIDHDIHHLPRLGRFARALSGIAPHGLFAVMGNHDHYAGVEQVKQVLSEASAEVLENRHLRVGDGGGQFVLGGLDDVVGNPDPERAFRGAPPELARVLLSHNPGFFPRSHPFADLTLSGHTHGGQISLFINTAELVLKHGFVRGHYQTGESQLYVNRGFGTAGPPTRIGSKPEITSLVLHT